MRTWKTIIICCLTLAMLLSIGISTGLAEEDRNHIVIEERTVEEIMQFPQNENMKTEYANAYQTSEDTVTYVIGTEKINFMDENGTWQEVSNAIVQNKGEKGPYNYSNEANDFITSFGVNENGDVISNNIDAFMAICEAAK